MRMIVPVPIGASQITASNITEADYPEFAVGQSYAKGARVIVAAKHKIYESVTAHTSSAANAPTVAGGATWVEVGATNKFKPFDGYIADAATWANSITYTIKPGALCNSVVLFGLKGRSAALYAVSPSAGIIYSKFISLIGTDNVYDEYTYCFSPINQEGEAIFANIPPYFDASFSLTITASGTASVGQIVMGEDVSLGITKAGTKVTFEDYSQKTRDAFGRAAIIPRAFADVTEFDFAFPSDRTRAIRDLIAAQRAKPAVYYTRHDKQGLGTLVYGLAKPLSVVLTSHNISDATLEVESLV